MTEYEDSTMESDSNIKPTTSTQESAITAGQSATAVVDPAAEATYWSENHLKRAYVLPDKRYKDYEPAFRHGWESRARSAHRPFREVEGDLERGWERVKGESSLTCIQAWSGVCVGWLRAGRPAEVNPAPG